MKEEALKASRKAFELEPENPEVLCDYGWSLVEMGRPQEAIPHLERAVALNPDYKMATANLTECRRRMLSDPK